MNKYTEYFDSFGLNMANDVAIYLSTSGKQIIYSGDEIQERDCFMRVLVLVLCSGKTEGKICIGHDT